MSSQSISRSTDTATDMPDHKPYSVEANLPKHCGEPMDVCAGAVFECIVCDARLTLEQIDEIAMSGPLMKNEYPIEFAHDEMAVYGGES